MISNEQGSFGYGNICEKGRELYVQAGEVSNKVDPGSKLAQINIKPEGYKDDS